jgi:hypothetical protein
MPNMLANITICDSRKFGIGMWKKVRVGLTGPRISYRSETQAKHRKIIAPQRYTGIVRLQKISKMFPWREEGRERVGSMSHVPD